MLEEQPEQAIPSTVKGSEIFAAGRAVSKARRRRRKTITKKNISEQKSDNVVADIVLDQAKEMTTTSESPRDSVPPVDTVPVGTSERQTTEKPDTADVTTTVAPPTTAANSTGGYINICSTFIVVVDSYT